MVNAQYKFLEKEWVDGVAGVELRGLGLDRLQKINPTLTEREGKDYCLWTHFYNENKSKVWAYMHSNNLLTDNLISEVAKLCAPYYERNLEEFVKNVEKVQDVIDVMYK